MDDAVEDAVEKLKDSGKLEIGLPILINPVVNAHSGKPTECTRKVEAKLTLAIMDAFPGVRVESASEALAGSSQQNKVIVQATGEQKGSIAMVRIRVLKNAMDGELLASADFTFESQKQVRKALVAVLDIEAGSLNGAQRRSVSDYLKSKLSQHSDFAIASSAEIAKFDPDQVQKVYQCSRDECAVIIGEQMGVDRVVSTSMNKLSETSYFLSAKLVNIKTSENLVISTREFKGRLEGISSLFPVLNQMALELAGKSVNTGGSVFGQKNSAGFSGSASIQRVTPKVTGNKRSNVAALFLNTKPSGADVYLGALKLGKTPFQNMNMTAGKTLLVTFKHPDYLDKRIEVTLSGGINKVDTLPLVTKYGQLNITSEPEGAKVTLAGQVIGTTPVKDYKIAYGEYLISVEKDYYFPVSNQQLKVRPSETINRDFDLKANFGVLDLNSNPQKVHYQILDENHQVKKEGTTPAKFRLDAGKYSIKLQKEGYDTLEFNAAVPLGETLKIEEKQASLRRQEGFLIISSNPYEEGASIFFDGEKIGVVPGDFTLPAGKHSLRIESGYKTGSTEVQIEDGKTQTVSIPIIDKFTRDEMESSHALWTAGLYGTFGGGVAMMVYALNENNAVTASNDEKKKYLDLVPTATSREQAQSYLDQAKAAENDAKTHEANTRTGILVSAGVFALWGYLYMNEPPDPDELTVIPVATPNAYGIALKTSF